MKKNRWIGIVFFLVLLVAWGFFYSRCVGETVELFPERTFEIFPLNDAAVGGFSTSEVQATDTLLISSVVIHSGKAFTYAGIGFNLKSKDKRPVAGFDLTKYDSMEVHVASKRMNSMKLRILTDDPVYSRNGDYATLRVLEKEIPSSPYLLMGGAKERFAVSKLALSDFRVPEWWLSQQGLEEDDGKTYLDRTSFFEIVSGSSTLRGIPDEMEVRYVRIWGHGDERKNVMFIALGAILFGLVLFLVCSAKLCRRENAKKLDA